ncbi:DUF3102 domain-containing protein [Paenibacillus sp. UASWS1643]|uniref:DUF3102 domain-containing protein n=1 Tax=Paenibacillus sp. UASWS1643 TaxID=2580422 RepID=UPI0012384732|nr:DUF3102 domain-containing protein [Paenibacillus sp. UASWS1643]KAA8750201.1 DUF3102 domain-containing protein [Paenibacillus sp. UASWS1643]
MTTNESVNEAATLSSDLPMLTTEINAYKRVAGEAIFEIGRRLKHVKDLDLAHGQWEQWCREKARISPPMARKYIEVYEECERDSSFRSTSNDLGNSLDKLYTLATLPPEERSQLHTLSSGATKTVDEMTVRELREVKAALKAEKAAREQAESRARKAEEDYDVVRDALDAASTTYADDGLYRIDNQTEVNGAALAFSDRVRDFLKEYAYLTNYSTEFSTSSDASRAEYRSAIDALEDFVVGFRCNLNTLTSDDAIIIDITNPEERVKYV